MKTPFELIFCPTGRCDVVDVVVVVVVVVTGFSSFLISFLITLGDAAATGIRAGITGDVGVDFDVVVVRAGLIPGRIGNSIGAPFGVDGRGE